eukprot:gene5590-6279_t
MADNSKIQRGLGVDVFTPDVDLEAPFCPHGPTIIFERYFKDKTSRKFFACSASRDRKGCSFFQWVDEKLTTGKTILQNEIKNQLQVEKDEVEKLVKFWKDELSSDINESFLFCVDCSILMTSTTSKNHDSHQIRQLSSSDLQEPSKFMTPVENKKTNAQYLFSDKSCHVIINTLTRLGFEKIICLGVPRIHEKIQIMKRKNKQCKQSSILLDLDKRYAQFFGSMFFRYNMFTNYFFGGEECKEDFANFIGDTSPSKIALVMDPPFGGVMSILASALKKLLQFGSAKKSLLEEKEMAILMIFPYFLENHVVESFPSLKMMDYKVCYKNHPTYKEKSKDEQRGSPIRIFTNIADEKFFLPKNEGYRYCKKCTRYVAMENIHCSRCNACTSKDGRTYVHCDLCQKCVKPNREHCSTCNKCDISSHDCEMRNKDPLSCHKCGEIGHKRKDCPLQQTRKRSASSADHDKASTKKPKVCKADKAKKLTRKTKTR